MVLKDGFIMKPKKQIEIYLGCLIKHFNVQTEVESRLIHLLWDKIAYGNEVQHIESFVDEAIR